MTLLPLINGRIELDTSEVYIFGPSTPVVGLVVCRGERTRASRMTPPSVQQAITFECFDNNNFRQHLPPPYIDTYNVRPTHTGAHQAGH